MAQAGGGVAAGGCARGGRAPAPLTGERVAGGGAVGAGGGARGGGGGEGIPRAGRGVWGCGWGRPPCEGWRCWARRTRRGGAGGATSSCRRWGVRRWGGRRWRWGCR